MNKCITVRATTYRDVTAVEYLAETVGDGIPLHVHGFNHLTKCIAGRIECFTKEGKSRELSPEDGMVEYKAGVVHGIRALSPGARFMNLMPAGTPSTEP